ncbi:MAG: hypothetical protein ACLUS6_11610 [Dysosmobacter sp.]
MAVHISNLMKKGYITGKGYIVHTAPYVTVVGGVNMDIGGWPGGGARHAGLQPRRGADEPGRRGPEHRPQHELCLGMDVRMVTVFGDDIIRPEDRRQLRGTGHRHLPIPGDPGGPHLHLSLHHRREGRHGAGRQRYGNLQAI